MRRLDSFDSKYGRASYKRFQGVGFKSQSGYSHYFSDLVKFGYLPSPGTDKFTPAILCTEFLLPLFA